MGRVIKVTTVDNNVVVETEAPALNEVFEKLTVEYDMNNIQSVSQLAVKDNSPIDENNYMCFTRMLEIKDMDLTCALLLGVNISSSIQIDSRNNINNQQYGFGMMVEATINYAPSIEGEYSKIRDFGDGIVVHLPYASPSILGRIQFSWITEAKGAIAANYTATAIANRVFYVSKNGSTIQTSKDNEGESALNVEFDSELHLEGELFSALGIKLDLCLFGRKEFSVGLGTEIGPYVKAEIELSSEDENVYDELKDECVTLQGLLKTKSHAQAKLFCFDKDWSKDLGAGWTFWETSRYLFPEFEKLSLNIENGKSECSATIGRDLLFKSEVGIAQYDINKKLVENSEPEPYFLEKDFVKNPLKASFAHKEDHTYWSYLKWDEVTIRCKQLAANIVGKWKGCDFIGTCKNSVGPVNDEWWVAWDFYQKPWEWEICNDGSAKIRWYDYKNGWDPWNMTWNLDEINNILILSDYPVESQYSYKERFIVESVTSEELVITSIHDGFNDLCDCKEENKIIFLKVKSF